jgi:hypothetical protein
MVVVVVEVIRTGGVFAIAGKAGLEQVACCRHPAGGTR